MAGDDFMQVRVGEHTVGIIGMKQALEEVAGRGDGLSDDGARAELLHILGKKNYIPQGAVERYGHAFLREYKKLRGEPVEDEPSRGLSVTVLGPGCARCDMLEREVIRALSELRVEANLEHVRDARQIGTYGVMGTPALVVNGRVKCVGTVPPLNRIVEWIREAAEEDVRPAER